MSKAKRESKYVSRADRRLLGIKTIDSHLVLDGGVGVKSLTEARNKLEADLGAYNTLLTKADVALDAVRASERKGQDQLERVLAGIAAKYGRNSEEYKKAGGKRRSEIKHPRRTAPASTDARPSRPDARAAG
ncbi:hypothetical protein HY251_07750 [bacterium]|nr:hypothetical protein [bacterium]